ncbi:CLUMA_CG016350, isoform A [Clunio marinus]|uniref:CLUMA_CG016350, isoform A n=1 Tax=Clunio marinus TaxID=568069 RepID=A0A1J1IUG2_9DIPT|nr:CLUMA_CG016350, isoform A [Clunio marinus]
MDLYSWGANSHGQLGVGTFSEFEFITLINKKPEGIKAIACGGGHSIILDCSGDLWTSGWNNKGQLGIKSKVDTNLFEKINSDCKFRSISCGWDTSSAITLDNRIFVWGSNNYNQLGYSNKQQKVIMEPIELKLPNDNKALDIKFGLRHSAILTTTNQLYIIGSLKHFKDMKLSNKIIHHNSTEFLQIEIYESKIRQISSGQHHITFLNDRNEITSVGDNKFMQCTEVNLSNVICKLSSGWTHNGFLTDQKELYLNGRNNYGQLGNGLRSDFEKSLQFLSINQIDDFELGAEHGILKSNGKIFTWGWNEHGNCGNGSFKDVLEPKEIQLPHEYDKISVFAGSGFCMALCQLS